eukprot:11784320-Alexandrium_andersonii.AAC.1
MFPVLVRVRAESLEVAVVDVRFAGRGAAHGAAARWPGAPRSASLHVTAGSRFCPGGGCRPTV